MRDTSLEAYKHILDVGSLGENQRKVYTIIKNLPGLTDMEIAKYLSLPINCITGRRNELLEAGFIEDAGKKENPTGRMAHCWKITETPRPTKPKKVRHKCEFCQGRGYFEY